MGSLFKKIGKTVQKFSMLEPGDRVIVAVSGGADSVCLLYCLVELSSVYGLELLAAHFNHKLRGGESEGDRQFVEDLCRRLGVALSLGAADLKEIAKKRKGSLEEICRERRHNFLLSLMRDRGFEKIALGHNLDDQAETMLMNVIRGAGLDGLKGIDPARDRYIRPLIEVTKEEIAEFLKKRKIPFRSDSSNLDNSFRRNSIRNNLIPEIRDRYNPSITAALGRLAAIARTENSYLDRVSREELDRLKPRIKLKEFLRLDPAIQNRVLKMALEELSPVKGGISHEHINSARDVIAGANPGASIDLPYGISVRREYGFVVIGRGERKRPEYRYVVNVPGVLRVKEAGMEFRFSLLDAPPGEKGGGWNAYLDYGKVVPPLVFRNTRAGDRIQPFGMEGHKKLQDVFTDRKIPRACRWMVPVLADAESILWVPGVVTSERTRIAAGSGNVLSVEKI